MYFSMFVLIKKLNNSDRRMSKPLVKIKNLFVTLPFTYKAVSCLVALDKPGTALGVLVGMPIDRPQNS